MYSPIIDEEQIRKLYKIKCLYSAIGEKVTMVDLVRESLVKYLPKKLIEANKLAKSKGLVILPITLVNHD